MGQDEALERPMEAVRASLFGMSYPLECCNKSHGPNLTPVRAAMLSLSFRRIPPVIVSGAPKW